MSEPTQHPSEETLIEYVAGHSSEGVSLLVACHATLCGRCQGRVQALDALAGATLEATAGLPLRDDALESVMTQLERDAAPLETEPAPRVGEAAAALGLPRPLLRYLDRAGGLKWRFRLPGIHVVPLQLGAATPAGVVVRLVRFKAGMTVPLHGHAGSEYTLTFSGAFEDAGVRYARGDVRIRDAGEHHVRHILPGEDCVVLAINHGALIPLTWTGRLMSWLGERQPSLPSRRRPSPPHEAIVARDGR